MHFSSFQMPPRVLGMYPVKVTVGSIDNSIWSSILLFWICHIFEFMDNSNWLYISIIPIDHTFKDLIFLSYNNLSNNLIYGKFVWMDISNAHPVSSSSLTIETSPRLESKSFKSHVLYVHMYAHYLLVLVRAKHLWIYLHQQQKWRTAEKNQEIINIF